MTTETVVFTDPMPAIKAWAEGETHIVAANADRVFFATPSGFEQSPPASWLVLTLITLETDTGDGPYVFPHVQFDCWATTGAGAGALRAAVETAVRNLIVPVRGAGSVIYGAELLTGGGWTPDRESRRPRYVLTARFLTRAA